jgi:hypothetical protein
MQDDDILLRIKNESPYLTDDGFSQRVMDALPEPRRYRQQVIGISWTLALILGLVLWISGGPGLTLFSLQPALLLSAATLTFWAIVGLFVFVAKDEGLLDI